MALALPGCMGFWWFFAQDPLLTLLRFLTEPVVLGLMPDKILGILTQDRVWLLKTSLSPIDNPMNLLGIPIFTNRLTVSYPLLWGLILATPEPKRLRQLLLGTFSLLPVTVIMALLLIQFKLALNINHEPVLTEMPQGDYLLILPYASYQYYLMAVGRQLAMLVLPTLAPVAIWLILHREFIRAVVLEGLLSRSLEHSSHT